MIASRSKSLLEAKLGRPRVSGGYRGDCAQQRANRLKAKPRAPRKMVCGNAIWERVIDVLRTGLSPEQASGLLRTMNDPIRINHEAIPPSTLCREASCAQLS